MFPTAMANFIVCTLISSLVGTPFFFSLRLVVAVARRRGTDIYVDVSLARITFVQDRDIPFSMGLRPLLTPLPVSYAQTLNVSESWCPKGLIAAGTHGVQLTWL